MANTDNNTISLHVASISKYLERECVGTDIIPGRFVKIVPDGFSYANAGSISSPTVAVENPYTDEGIGSAYEVGEKVYARVCLPGDEVLAWLKDGDTVTEGNALFPSDWGILSTDHSPTIDITVAVSLENVTASGSDIRIRVEVA